MGGTPKGETAGCTRRSPCVPVLLYACLFAIALIAGGCAAGGPPERQHYILEAGRQGPPVETAVDALLQVHPFHVDAAFAARSMVYRLGESRYEADSYRRFLITPDAMIAEQTRNWLVDAGLFVRVLPRGSRIVPDYSLEANVTALFGDFSSESLSAAVMEIRFFLVKETDGAESVVFAKTYRATNPVSSRTTTAFVQALNRNLAEILTQLEADLRKALAQAPR